ncbi:hypothetical protein G7046_g2227 [Stylonectria norvegica]|nr:hypothetical protein G7046_g2227 [Stylonectria norvegica]
MGFLSFWTRRTTGEKSSGLGLKSQAYDSTVAAVPPIRGTYPVAGNGPNVLDQLQRAARKRSQAQLSTQQHQDPHQDPHQHPHQHPQQLPHQLQHQHHHQDVPSVTAAPAPLVPRFRGAYDQRPSSAPSQSVNLHPRPKSGGRGSVSRASHSTRTAWPLILDGNHAARSDDDYSYTFDDLPPVPAIAAHHRHEESFDTLRGSVSGSVDVLDAQGELKPSSFRSRLKAAGAREYGEDVAERNLGQNALDVRSSAVQSFYAASGVEGHSIRHSIRPIGSTVDIHGNIYYPDDLVEELDESAPPPVISRGELSRDDWANRFHGRESRALSLVRPKSSGLSAWNPFPRSRETAEREVPRLEVPRFASVERRPETHHGARNSSLTETSLADRRRSFNAFASPPPGVRSKPRPLSIHPSLSNFSSEPMSPPPLPSVPRTRPKTSGDKASRQRTPTPREHGESRPRTRHGQKAKTSTAKSSSGYDEPSRGRKPTKARSYASLPQRVSSPEPFTYGGDLVETRDESFVSPAPSPHIQSRSRRRERQSVVRPETHDGYYGHAESQDRPETHDGYYGHARGDHSHPLSRPSSSPSVDPPPPRTRSIGGASIPGRKRLEDITEHIPIRTSSLGTWGLALTPTTMSSGTSSNPFPRPHSQHTANTSVDETSPAKSVEKAHERQGSVATSGGNPESLVYFTAAEEDDYPADIKRPSRRVVIPVQPSYSTRRRSHVEEDSVPEYYEPVLADYSDTDSFTGDSRQPSAADHGVMFDELIYGDVAKGLPGLFDAISGTSSSIAPRTSVSLAKPLASSSKSVAGSSRRREKLRHSHSTPFAHSHAALSGHGFSSDDEDNNSFSDSEFDIMRGRAFRALPELSTQSMPARLAIYGLEEEDKEKVNMRTAAQLRKDAKRKNRRRASHAYHGRRRLGRIRGDDDEGHAADTEDSGSF